MSDPRLSALAVQIEDLKARLAEISETGERRVLLQEMHLLINEADRVLQGYVKDLPDWGG